MIKQMRIDFYRVMFGATPLRTLGTHLLEIQGKPTAQSRNCQLSGETYRLQELSGTAQRLQGDMLRIRMENLPIKASMDGSLDDFDLDEDEGMGEESAFEYDGPLAVLAFQRNRSGVSASRFCDYIARMSSIGDVITLDPILNADAMTRYQSMRRVTRFDLKCARPDQADFWDGESSVAQSLRDLSPMNATQISISATMGRTPGSLTLAEIRRMVTELVAPEKRTLVKTLEISGRSTGDEMLVVDLIGDRMVEVATVDAGRTRHAPYESRADRIAGAFRSRRAELNRMFAPRDRSSD